MSHRVLSLLVVLLAAPLPALAADAPGLPFDPADYQLLRYIDHPAGTKRSEDPADIERNPHIIPIRNADGTLDVCWIDRNPTAHLRKVHLTRYTPKSDNSGYDKTWTLTLPGEAKYQTNNHGNLVGFGKSDANTFYISTATRDDRFHIQYVDKAKGFVRPVSLHKLVLTPDPQDPKKLPSYTTTAGAPWAWSGSNWPAHLNWAGTGGQGDNEDPIFGPISIGSGRLAVGGGYAMAYMSRWTNPDSGNVRHHNTAWRIVSADTGLTSLTKGFSQNWHNWDVRLIHDGTDFVAVDLSQDRPSLYIAKYHRNATGAQSYKSTSWPEADPRLGVFTRRNKGQDMYTVLGGLATGGKGYVVLFAAEQGDDVTSYGANRARDLAMVHVVKDFDETQYVKDTWGKKNANYNNDAYGQYDSWIVHKARGGWIDSGTDQSTTTVTLPAGSVPKQIQRTGVVWLTNGGTTKTIVDKPKLVKMPTTPPTYVCLYEKWTTGPYNSHWKATPVPPDTAVPQSNYGGSFAMIIDEYGNSKRAETSLAGKPRLMRGDDPLVVTLGAVNYAAWITGDHAGRKLVLHLVDGSLNHTTKDLEL